jgi:hypothetical protein
VRAARRSGVSLSARIAIRRFTLVTLLASVGASDPAVAQWMGKQTGCYADSIAANPNRPTVSNPAHVTQYGFLELEHGLDRTFAGVHPNFDGCELMILNKIGRGEDLNHRPLGYEPF